MKVCSLLVLLSAFLAFTEAATFLNKRQAANVNKARRVVRRRGRQRESRQLFGSPIVAAPAPLPFAAAPLHFAPQQFVAQPNPFIAPHPVQLVEVRNHPAANNAPANIYQTPAKAVEPNYGSPAAQVAVEEPQQQQQESVIQVRTQPAAPAYIVPAASRNIAVAQPIAITRSVYNAPGTRAANLDEWDYAFETENGIKQSAVGEMRTVGDSDVIVMRGSYEYPGPDGLIYTVDWEADENGFRASAPHLPKPVEIPFPEQREAVEAQIRFAAEQRSAAASSPSASYERLPSYTY